MYRIGCMELVGLSQEEGVLISWLPEGLGIQLAQRKLENLKRQYEEEMEALRQQLELHRQRSDHVDHQRRSQYLQVVSSFREALEDTRQQKELDSVVGQLHELHQRQLQQLNAQHLHDTALQVTAMRLTVEQVQASRLKLLEEEHEMTLQQLSKEHKDQLNALQAQLSVTNGVGVTPLTASEELTQQYQKLVQKISQSLQKEVLERLHGSEDEQYEDAELKSSGSGATIINVQQAEAIQQALEEQQEEVLLLRSKLLQEYEILIKQRTEGVSQQKEEIEHLQEQMADLHQQYEQQIAEFQSRIDHYNEEEEERRIERCEQDAELEDIKAMYEQRIANMEQSFSSQIAALQQTAGLVSMASGPSREALSVNDGGDSGQVRENSVETESDSLTLGPAEELEYAVLTTVCGVETDTVDSAHVMTFPKILPPISKLQVLQDALQEKTALVAELEQCLEEEKERLNDALSQLDLTSKELAVLSAQLDEEKEMNESLQKCLESRDKQLEQAFLEQAESQKLLLELTEKETALLKEKDDLTEQLSHMQEITRKDSKLITSRQTVEDELKKIKASLEESSLALQAAETRELKLREKLSDAEHQHTEALEELRQELEHEAQVERETLQSEFQVQLDIELKRQASELKQQFAKQRRIESDLNFELREVLDTSSDTERTTEVVDVLCTPDSPHSGKNVQAVFVSIQNISSHPSFVQNCDNVEDVITEPLLTCQHYEPLQPSLSTKHVAVQTEHTGSLEDAEERLYFSLPTTVPSSNDSYAPVDSNTLSFNSANQLDSDAELKTDFDRQIVELRGHLQAHQERVAELETLLKDAQEKCKQLEEDVKKTEPVDIDALLKDRYDLELELAKSLMQQEFDGNLQAEKKKFVERHRKLMDDFMSDCELEAEEIKQKHLQEMEILRTSLTDQYSTQIAALQAEIQQLQITSTTLAASSEDRPEEKSVSKKHQENLEDLQGSEEVTEINKELKAVKEVLEETKAKHMGALKSLEELQGLKEQLENSESKKHQENLEALQGSEEVTEIKKELKAVKEVLEETKAKHMGALKSLEELQGLKEQLEKSESMKHQENLEYLQGSEEVTEIKKELQAVREVLEETKAKHMEALKSLEELQGLKEQLEKSESMKHQENLEVLQGSEEETEIKKELQAVKEVLEETKAKHMEALKSLEELQGLKEQLEKSESMKHQENLEGSEEVAEIKNELQAVKEVLEETKAKHMEALKSLEELQGLKEQLEKSESLKHQENLEALQGSEEVTEIKKELKAVKEVLEETKAKHMGALKSLEELQGLKEQLEKSESMKHQENLEYLQGSEEVTEIKKELQAVKEVLEETKAKHMEALKSLEELQGLKEQLEKSESLKHQENLEDLQGSEEVTEIKKELQAVKEVLEETKAKHTEALKSLEELQGLKEQQEKAQMEHADALSALKEEYEARISELRSVHQEELEAAALDTDVVKSELEQAHQAELKQLQEHLLTPTANKEIQTDGVSKETATVKHVQQTPAESRPGPEAMHAVSEISLSLQHSDQTEDQSSQTEEIVSDLRSSLEYEETDEEGSIHSFSSMIGKTNTFADTKATPPVSPQRDQMIKQLQAQVEQLTQQLAQSSPLDMSTTILTSATASLTSTTASQATTIVSPDDIPQAPPSLTSSAAGAQARDLDLNMISMLQSDLEHLNAERDIVQQTNNRLLQLLSDSVHTYVEVEDTINRRLHNVVTASAIRPHSPVHLSRLDNHGDFATPRRAGFTSFSSPRAGAGVMASPRTGSNWRSRESGANSPTLEETSILSSATDEGLDMSQRLTESIFTGPDIDAEGEEIVSDARGRLQNAVARLLEMIERTTQQLLDAKTTQNDLLETLATRRQENDDLSAHIHDLEEQVGQEVAAKEYLGLELHKAEGLISGYSSERGALEEQLQSLEEQKEVLASELETTRSRLQEFQEAAEELEARHQDVERQQTLLQENAGQETQESAMAGGDATMSKQKALLNEMSNLKQDSREQTLQLQHRLVQAEHRLQEKENALEELEKEQQQHLQALRRQVDDLRLQLENSERQLKSNKLFLDEQLMEREQEREEYQKEVENLKMQLLNKEKQSDSEHDLQHEIQELTEQLQGRIDMQTLMHQQTRELQASLQERDLSAQDLRRWINTLEQELDQRGDAEEQLKGRIQKLENSLSTRATAHQSDKSVSPISTLRPDSPGILTLSATHLSQQQQNQLSLEEELKRSRQAEEELIHEKEALKKMVQEQLLQISALRNQLDEMRHWTGPTDSNVGSSSTADLREQLDTEREKLERAEEELSKLTSDHKAVEDELAESRREGERLKQQMLDSAMAAQRILELEEARNVLQNRITELSDVGPFPPELLDEKNAEIEELRQQLTKAETQLKEKEELVSDLQDSVLSLQRGEPCLDVSLSFNEPIQLNASFTERLPAEEQPSSVTSLAQELDQTVEERETHIMDLTAEVERLTSQLAEQQEKLSELQTDKTALEAELHHRDEDLSLVCEEKTQKQEALMEKEARLEQLVEQINSLQSEITSLTSFQTELQKDFDTVQAMLDEKEREIETLTKELLDSRSLTEGSDVSDLEAELAAVQRQLREQQNVVDEKEEELYELNEKLDGMEALKVELQSLKAQILEKDKQLEEDKCSFIQLQQEIIEKTELLERERKRCAELQQTLEEIHQQSSIDPTVIPSDEQMSELKTQVSLMEDRLKDKEALIKTLEEEKNAELSEKERELVDIQLHLLASEDNANERVADLEKALETKHQQLQEAEFQKQEELEKLQQELSRQEVTGQQLKTEQQTLQQQADSQNATISSLHREMSRLKEQLQLAKSENTATDDVKSLQEKLQQALDQAEGLGQQVISTQTRLDQTCTQLAEREEQIQQLQAEVQSLRQENPRHVSESSGAAETLSPTKTPDSGEDSEAEEKLQDVLTRARHMQVLVRDSLSSSLPMSNLSEVSSLARWESEPGLSSNLSIEIAAQTQVTEAWLRRQQRELAAKNRELATVRQELEAWLRRRDRNARTNEYSASVMTMTLRLQEKEVLIASLKRELMEARELLAASEKSAETSLTSGSHSLSPQTQQQIAHLRSELQQAKSALAAIQEQSGSENERGEVRSDGRHVQKPEAELRLLKSSSSKSTKVFSEETQDLHEELSEEHQHHILDIQAAAQQDLERKLSELQCQHDHEIQQLEQLHQRKQQQALAKQYQELQKQHKTAVNHLKVQHQQEIDHLQKDNLGTLTDASWAQRLQVDISATQRMDQRMIGALTPEEVAGINGNNNSYGISDEYSAQLQALLDRLREAGEHILSVSELDLLRRHLSHPGQVIDERLRESWDGEKMALLKTVHALKELLSQADRAIAGHVEESVADWRSELIHALVEVYQEERRRLEAELNTVRLQQEGKEHADIIKSLDNRLQEQEQLHQNGLDALLRAERQSLLSELEDLRKSLAQQRQEKHNVQSQLAKSLAQQEETSSSNMWKLQRDVQVLEYKLQQEQVIEEDLRKSLQSERQRVAELTTELSQEKSSLFSLQSELQTTQLQLARAKDALERELNRLTSITNALEEERKKNSHINEKLETLQMYHNSLESDVEHSDALRRERESVDSRFIKELQAELTSERQQLFKAVQTAEEQQQERKRAEAELEKEQQQTTAIRQAMEKLRLESRIALEAETSKLNALQRLKQKEEEQIQDLEHLLADRETTIHQLSNRNQHLQSQVQQLQTKCSSTEQQLSAEHQKLDSLMSLMEKERQQQLKLQEQEQALGKQLRQDLSKAKMEAGEARCHLELEKARSGSLRLELEHYQSELRAITQHAGATERQLENEQSSTWKKLRLAQHERDDLQIKVHELELEMDRLHDRLQDLELELDRSRQRELQVRHEVERQKLFSASPLSTPRSSADTQLQSRLNTFCLQVQSIGQRLQTLVLKQRDHNASTTESEGSNGEAGKGRSCVEALLTELQALQKKMAAGDQVDLTLAQELEQLQENIRQLRAEKEALQHRLALLEDGNNLRTPHAVSNLNSSHNHPPIEMPQYSSDLTDSNEENLYDHTAWASERFSLQMALDSAEREIDRLKRELRSFRGRFNSEGFMVEADRDKMQRLYGKYLRAESFRKALVYQKKYLLLLLGGYQDSEQETLAVIATMGGQPSSTYELAFRRRHRRLYTIFRSAARMVVAIFRMKYLVRKWRRATRVGSPVVAGIVNQQYGYVAAASSFSPPNAHERQSTASGTSAHVHTLTRSGQAIPANGNTEGNLASPHPVGEAHRRFYTTPPTKESSYLHKSSSSSPSSSARRQLMADPADSRLVDSQAEETGGNRAAVLQADTRDDFIQRLENLQTRLSSGTQNVGVRSQHRSDWR